MKVMHPAKEVRHQGIWGCLNSRVTVKVLAGFDWVSPQLTWSTLRPCLRYSKDANWEGYQISSLQAHYGFLACFSIEEVWWRATQVHCLIRSTVICRITSNRRNFNLPIYGFKGLCKWSLIYTSGKKKKNCLFVQLKLIWPDIWLPATSMSILILIWPLLLSRNKTWFQILYLGSDSVTYFCFHALIWNG